MTGIDRDRLESWKEIAAHLGRDERTAMRWAKQGMPVRRVPGGKRGRVYASRADIERWLGERSTNSVTAGSTSGFVTVRPRRGIYAIWAVTAALVVVSLFVSRDWLFNSHASGELTGLTFTANSIQGRDGFGNTIWEHRFPQEFFPSAFKYIGAIGDFVRIADLFGDGNREVLAIVPFHTGSSQGDPWVGELVCFSSWGKLLWTYVPDETFQFGNHKLAGPWAIYDVFVSKNKSKPRIWIAGIHHSWGNTFVAEIDPLNGKGRVRFVNPGVLYKLNEVDTSRGSYLLAGGFDSEYHSGVLAIVDTDKPFAASPQTEATRYKCDSCPPGSPDFFFVFPQSEINQIEKWPEDPINGIVVGQDGIEVSKAERQFGHAVQIIYTLDDRHSFAVRSFLYDTGYDMLHAEFQKQGKVDHSLEECPERLHPRPVRLWTPAGGWSEIKFPPMKATD